MQLLSEMDKFQNSSMKSTMYDMQEYVLNGRPVYYNKDSTQYVYATKNGIWVVISKYNIR